MTLLYQIGIYLYSLAIRVSAMFGNEKAKLFIAGRKNILSNIKNKLQPGERRVWFHVASLGEFEQGRPVMEAFKAKYPEIKIVVTFFSPSGYEVRKNYTGADYIFYLPMDTLYNAKKFVNLVNPEKAFFIKYEYWHFYISQLYKKNIPIYLCSSIFRPNQVFFKWYGGWYRKILTRFAHIFVQTQKSADLLQSIGISNITLTGDTRFDRVYSIASNARELKEVETFTKGTTCLIAGSTWEPDDELVCSYLNSTALVSKAIIAPHEIGESHLEKIEQLLSRPAIRYSKWKDTLSGNYDVLIIDNIGMLSSLYRYAQVAYIGGGFGKGIHNILEAATYGLPVIFGPNHQKFQEALDLIEQGGAFHIKEQGELNSIFDKLYSNSDFQHSTGNIAKAFVKNNTGATNTIISYTTSNIVSGL
jgi:3-deoxy-D-manno-octulosonic-acid transferase